MNATAGSGATDRSEIGKAAFASAIGRVYSPACHG